MKLKKKKCDINIMIRGIGGQGVKLAGTILGEAAICDKRHAVQSMKYGSAITGGETRSEVKVSTEKIIYPRITDIDIYVALTQDDLENYFESQIYLAASAVAKDIPPTIKDKTILAPMLQIAESLGNIQAANMVMIGVLNQLFNIARDDCFVKSIKNQIPQRLHEINIEAYKKGKDIDLTEYNSNETLMLVDICKLKKIEESKG